MWAMLLCYAQQHRAVPGFRYSLITPFSRERSIPPENRGSLRAPSHRLSKIRISNAWHFAYPLICTCLLFLVAAQPAAAQKPQEQNRIFIEEADRLDFSTIQGKQVKVVVGTEDLQARFVQDDIILWCDSAVLDANKVRAYGEVQINQNDSITVFADQIKYNGDSKKANLIGDVILSDPGNQLFSEAVSYDLEHKVAFYTTGATLTDGKTQLTSKRGYYYSEQERALFKGDVVVINPDFTIQSDTLRYDVANDVTYFDGPTTIVIKDGQIYTEDGYYNAATGYAEFTKNPVYNSGTRSAAADIIRYDSKDRKTYLEGNARVTDTEKKQYASAQSIIYDEQNDITYFNGDAYVKNEGEEYRADAIEYNRKEDRYTTTGRTTVRGENRAIDADKSYVIGDINYLEGNVFIQENEITIQADTVRFNQVLKSGEARGNVIMIDTLSNFTLHSQAANYNDNNGSILTWGNPYLTTLVDEDSLYISADTLWTFIDTLRQDSARILIADNKVKTFSAQYQTLCDSLSYSSRDSIFKLFDQPIVWSDTSQFTADTIFMRLEDNALKQFLLKQNAMIINSPDERLYNQIQGTDITADFKDEELRRMTVIGNAQSIYYIQDERDRYIGVNKAKCSEMIIAFGNNQVTKIRFLRQADASILPMKQTNHSSLRLQGFDWKESTRPKSKFDILK